MKLLRNLGDTSQILNVFVQDASVSTGAGLANAVGSSVAYSWWHDNQSGASTGTASTAGAMGTYSTSAWVQISSSQALGWYQFGAPDGMWAAGKSVALHLYGAVNMVPVPIEIDLNAEVNVTDIMGSAAVTSAAGTLNVSTQTIDKTGYNATTTVNLDKTGYNATTTTNLDKTGYNATTTVNLDKTGYSVTGLNAALLDVSVSSRLAATGYTAPDNTGIAAASSVAVTALTESYRANGGTGTMAQLMYEIVAHMGETSITGTTKTINKLDHATAAETFQLDSSSSPASIKRLT